MGSPNTPATEGDNTADTLSALSLTSGILSGVPPAASSVVPSMSAPVPGVPEVDNTLPDLVVNQPGTSDADCQPAAATNTAEDLEAASALLSLGDTLEDTLEDDDDNALLMPIGGANNPEDIAPQQIRLDQVSMDNTIAGIVEMEELKRDTEKEVTDSSNAALPIEQVQAPANLPPTQTDQKHEFVDPSSNVQPTDDTAKKGSLKTKTYVLKKPEVKRSFKCSECNAVRSSIQKLKKHHRKWHNPQMCGICN